MKKLSKRQRDHLLKDITQISKDNKRVFAWSDEIKPVTKEERKTLESLMKEYVDSLDKEDKKANGIDDLVLEVKEVRTPIPAYFLPYREKFWDKYEHQGERVVATQKAMHHLEDPHLGYVTINGRHFFCKGTYAL